MSYLKRLGAIYEGNGRFYVSRGYERLYFTIGEEGIIDKHPDLPDPTGPEIGYLKQIAKTTVVPVTPALKPLPKLEGKIYEYRDAEGRLNMVTQRLEETGKPKKIVPWIFDGMEWVCQEWPPAIPSPLFGNHHGRSRVMIHEGEKATEAAIEASKSGSGHPWQSFLAKFGHCTWRGGAKRAHLANWKELDKDTEVWIMPDNDSEGYDAAYRIVNELSHVKKVMLFHHRFYPSPKRWDMADPPFLEDAGMLRFALAEKATFTVQGPQGRPKHVLRKEFAQKFAFAMSTNEFVEIDNPGIYYSSAEFNQAFAHLSGVDNLSKLMLASNHLVRVHAIGYRPGARIKDGRYEPPPKFYTSGDGLSYVNMYRPPILDEKPGKVKSLAPLLVFLRHLIPNPQERKIVIRWCSVLLVEKKLPWALLLISQTQGTGKSTLARMMRELVGPNNSGQVTSEALMDKFTSWALNKQLVVVPELKEGHAFTLAERLKTFIEDPTIPIRRMNVDQYDAENHMSILASSNHLSAISLAKEDRRWFVPKVTEKLPHQWDPPMKALARRYLSAPESASDTSFFRDLWEWFHETGASHCLYFGRRYGKALIDRRWPDQNGRAPLTEKKREIQSRSAMEWEDEVSDLLSGNDVIAVSPEDLREFLLEQKIRFVPRKEDIARFIEDLGFVRQFRKESPDPKIARGRVVLYREDGTPRRGYIHANQDLGADWSLAKPLVTWFSSRAKAAIGLGYADKAM